MMLLRDFDRARLLTMLWRHEGCRTKPYTDTVGKLTIGVGRNLSDVGVSVAEADYLLNQDVDRTIRGLVEHYPQWFPVLDPVRQAAIVDVAFNLGLNAFATFTKAITALARRDYETAARELLASRWAAQVQDRAAELAAMVRSGSWGPPRP